MDNSLLQLFNEVQRQHKWAISLVNQAERSILPFHSVIEDIKKSKAAVEAQVKEIERASAGLVSQAQITQKFYQDLLESNERWAKALEILHIELPKRGWYLTGEEPCTLTPKLARLVAEENWKAVDELLLANAASLSVKIEPLEEWLLEKGVATCCIQRLRLFLEHHQNQSHEVATMIGVPVIDELCRSLYDGKDFTSKRGTQPKPQIACTTEKGAKLGGYSIGFVEGFGSIHEQVDVTRLEDEDYFNRHAILHGLMKRNYGPKDSTKVFMVIMFLIFGLNEEVPEEPAVQSA